MNKAYAKEIQIENDLQAPERTNQSCWVYQATLLLYALSRYALKI